MIKYVGIEEARKHLGPLVTAAQQGSEIILTRNGRPAARIVAYREDPMTIADLTERLGLPAHEQSAVAAWTGDGPDATYTEAEIAELVAAWQADSDRIANEN